MCFGEASCALGSSEANDPEAAKAGECTPANDDDHRHGLRDNKRC